MQSWRKVGFLGMLAGALALAAVLPGCGGDNAGNTEGPNPEVQIVPPQDAQGKPMPVSDETSGPIPVK